VGQPVAVSFQALWGSSSSRRISNWLHGAFWFLYLGLLIRYWRRRLGEELVLRRRVRHLHAAEAFHGIYRYMVPLVPLTIAIARDRRVVQQRLIAVLSRLPGV
jgi:hypothetical protein